MGRARCFRAPLEEKTMSIKELIAPYQKVIEGWIEESLSTFGPQTELREACAYALKNGGKRFRPAIVLMMAEALGQDKDVSDAGLAVEFFHTASLIADDLPCMDDEEERRGVPALHHAFSEATALLATYALIAAGYERIGLNGRKTGAHLALPLALENAAKNTGIRGATGGQFLDLHPPQLDEEALLDIIEKKTGALFELSFVSGWLFGGGEIAQLDKVKQAAQHFGMAFQIVDDIDDYREDVASGRAINVLSIMGKERAFAALNHAVSQLQHFLKDLNLDTPSFHGLTDYLVIIQKRALSLV